MGEWLRLLTGTLPVLNFGYQSVQNEADNISYESWNSDLFLNKHLFALSIKNISKHRKNLEKAEQWKAFRSF